MFDVTCQGCNKPFKAKSPQAKWCDGAGGTCQRRKKRADEAAVTAADGKPTRTPKDGPLVTAVIAELDEAEKVHTVDGQIAVRIARELVVAKGTQVATLTKELRAVLDRALGPKQPPTPTDSEPELVEEEEPDELELARRRVEEKRRAAASV